MDKITMDLFTSFHYLSDLQYSRKDGRLFYIETECDMENNGYNSRLWSLDPLSGGRRMLTKAMPSLPYYVCERGLFTFEKDETGTAVKKRSPETGNVISLFSVPLSVREMVPYGEDGWLILALTNTECPDRHLLSEGEREIFQKEKEENSDYIVVDEYPFVFNGAGFVNGNRNRLFLLDGENNIRPLNGPFMNVSSWDTAEGKIVFSGMEYDKCQKFTSKVWEYDPETEETKVLYDGDDMQFRKVFYRRGEVIALASRDNGTGENPKVWLLKDGGLSLLMDPDSGFHNSLGTDCRYGKQNGTVRCGDDLLIISSCGDEALLYRLGDTFETVFACGGSVESVAASDDTLYMILMKDQALPEIYSFRDGVTRQLSDINKAVLQDRYVAVPRPLILEKETPVHGWVLEPYDYDPSRTYPAILDIHGGPRTIYGTVYYHEMQYWASLGYFVFFCNPRGSDGRGDAFADLRPAWGTIDYEDIMDFTDLVLKTYPAIDPDRLGVTGGSYGGYMTNWIITHTRRFKAAASQRSISNWISELLVSDISAGFIRSLGLPDIRHADKELWDMSPLKYVNDAATPVLFIHSTEDYRCPMPEAVQLFTALKLMGVESRLVMFKGENHELSRGGRPKHRIRRLAEITEWMNNHLNITDERE